ncbi:Alkaline phosphatase synthesis transcriptional regulatory protein PhoP [subsurface metagenome]
MIKKPRILLIDDDLDFVEATKTVLESKPYEVIVAYDGDDGLRKAKEGNPDLIILDILMPVKDGFATATQLKNDPKLSKIPVLVLTSFAERGGESTVAVSGGLTLETEDYIDKPISPDELLSRVEKYLKRAGF